MKPLKEAWQFLLWNADAGIADHELGVLILLAEQDVDLADKGKLEGVGEQVEDDLLPHLAVYIDRLQKRGAINDQAQPGFLDHRAEHARQARRQRGQIGGRIDGLNAPG